MQIISRLDTQFPAAMLVDWGKELCFRTTFRQIIISEVWEHAETQNMEKCLAYLSNVSISWLYLLNSFPIYFSVAWQWKPSILRWLNSFPSLPRSNLVPRAFPLKVGGAGKDPGIGWSRVHLTPWNPGCNKLAIKLAFAHQQQRFAKDSG